MSTSNIIGTVQVASGDIKIVALDGTSRAAMYGDYIFEGEQIVSDDSASLFQIRYLEVQEPKAYSGVFSIMADGSAVAEVEEDDVDVFETAAGEEGVESNSQNIEDNPEAIDYVQTFGRSSNDAVYSEERNLGEERQFGGTIGDENPPVIEPEGQTRLEFISESAAYNNVLGIYTLDEIGNPTNPQIVMTGTNTGGSPADSILDLEFGSFGLFVIPNGDYEGIVNATLSFDFSNPAQPLLLVDSTPTTVYFDNNSWNEDGKDHFDIVANSDGSINITIEDLNLGDNDRNDLHIKLTPIGDSVGGVVVEMPDGAEGENVDLLTTSGTLDFDDLDLEDTHTTSVSFTPDEDGYLGTFDASISTSATGAGEGEISWSFEVNDALLDSMGAYDSIVQTYTVTVTDNTGLSDTQEVKILIQGTNDAPEVSSEVITKVADHVIGEDIVEPADVDAVTFSWVCPFISDDAEVVVRNNGSYAVDDQNKVGWWIFAIPDGDKENFVDSKGLWNEGLIFSFENDVTNSTVGVSQIDTNDRVLVKLYDADGNEVHNMGVLDLHSGHSDIVIDEGVTFRSIGIYALDTWGKGSPETEFRVSSVTAVEPFEYDTVLDFVIDDAMLLDNDSDVEGDELEVQLTGDTNVYLGTEVVGSVSLNGEGDVQVTMNDTPETYEDGATLTFSYAVSDGIDISDSATATINVQHGDIDGVEVSYDQTSGEFIIGTDLGNEAMPENTLTVGETIDLSDVSNINTIQLEGDATVTGSSELGHVNPSDVLGATDSDNRLIIQSIDGDNASDQINVHESFGDAAPDAVEIDGSYYAEYTDGTATLLVEIDEPIEVV
jgi:VCBS repeat-containing protein